MRNVHPIAQHSSLSRNRESPTSADLPEAEIMERLRSGDEAALTALLDRYWKRLVKYALGFCGDVDVAEDTVQESFVKIWQTRETWTSSGSVAAYLYRVVRNSSLDQQKKRNRRSRLFRAQYRSEPPATPAEDFDRKRVRLALQRCLETLSPRRREAVVLVRLHNLSYKQVAEIMGVSPQTVANQVSSAFRDLRKAVKREEF